MKKIVLSCLILMAATVAQASYRPFIEAETGILAMNSSQAPIYGVRGGFIKNGVEELSFGYWSAPGLPTDSLASGGLTLHTLSLEGYIHESLDQKLSFKWGGGIGFTIPNLNDGASETADNDLSLTLGAGLGYKISNDLDLAFSVKGFFFSTDTHLTIYGSHIETASDGTEVEVLDISHRDDSIKLNGAKIAISLRW